MGRLRRVVLVVWVAFGVSLLQAAEPPEADSALSLEAGAVHRHVVEVEGGEALTVLVEQLGVDVVVSVHDPEDRELARVDGPHERYGYELATVAIEAPGRYGVVVQAADGSPSGAYRWRAEVRSPRASAARLRLEAERATTRAGELYLEGTSKAHQAALLKLERALEIWQELGEARWQAQTLDILGALSSALGEPDAALESLRQARPLWQGLGDLHGEATTLHRMGFIHWRRGDHLAALAPYLRALELRRTSGDRFGQAQTLSNLGLVYLSRGAPRQARPYFERALEAIRGLPVPALRARILINLGGVHQRAGRLDEALARFSRALPLLEDLGDRHTEAIVRSNRGVAHRTSGELRQALESFLEARRIFREIGDSRREATALNNLGQVHADLGELSAARDRFEQALALRRETEDRRGEAVTLGNLGEVWRRQGASTRARNAFEQSLELCGELGDPLCKAMALDRLGRLELELGRPQAAFQPLEQALLLRREQGARRREAESLRHLARAHLAIGQPEDATALARTARALAEKLDDPAGAVEAQTLLAHGLRDLGKLEDARNALEAALEQLESHRLRMLDPSLRISRLAPHRETYELMVDVLMGLHGREPEAGWHRRALEVAERMRARGLLDLLAEAGVEIERGVSPDLLRHRRRLQRRWRGQAAALRRLSPEADAEERRLLRDGLQTVEAELNVVEDRIRRQSPAYARLVQPETLSADAMRQLAGDEAVLLEISLGEDRSFLWTIRGEGIEVYELPPRQRIEAAALTLHELWSRREIGAVTGTAHSAAGALSGIILDPIAQELGGSQSLAVVPDGALHLIPWGALPHPAGGEPLLAHHEVVHLPSASVLALQRRRLARPRSPSITLWADPVFSAEDPRVPYRLRQEEITPVLFSRLPRSAREAERVAAEAPEGAEVRLVQGFKARRDAVVEEDLERFQILHFATHGILDEDAPRRSGLVLSMVDGGGRPLDGFLGLQDVYDLELNADLVVLSGCRTALGRRVRGEGLVGLAHGFFHAGARRIVASLWPVEDRAVAELMETFYAEMWSRGSSPAEALRAASLALRHNPRWRDPRHWAAFVLLGDWR